VFWQATQTPRRDLTVFVHLYDAAGQLVASHDGQPVYGYLPTTRWPAGELIPDRHDISLPKDLPAGDYTLATGLYDAASGARMAVMVDGQTVEQRAVTLTTLSISRPLSQQSYQAIKECESHDNR